MLSTEDLFADIESAFPNDPGYSGEASSDGGSDFTTEWLEDALAGRTWRSLSRREADIVALELGHLNSSSRCYFLPSLLTAAIIDQTDCVGCGALLVVSAAVQDELYWQLDMNQIYDAASDAGRRCVRTFAKWAFEEGAMTESDLAAVRRVWQA